MTDRELVNYWVKRQGFILSGGPSVGVITVGHDDFTRLLELAEKALELADKATYVTLDEQLDLALGEEPKR